MTDNGMICPYEGTAQEPIVCHGHREALPKDKAVGRRNN